MDSPVLKVSLYKRNETDSLGGYSLIPLDLTNIFSADVRAGIETTKDTFTLRMPNDLILTTGSFNLQADSTVRSPNDIKIGDLCEISAYDAIIGRSANTNDELIISGNINSFDHNQAEEDSYVTFKGVNRTEALLQGYALGTYDVVTTTNKSPIIITEIIKRLRHYAQVGLDKRIYAALDNAYIYDEEIGINSTTYPTGITGSYGNIASAKVNGEAFKEITYKKIWQPTYKIIEDLSTVENTGDEDAGAYLCYIKNTPVIPDVKGILRTITINELVWKPVSLIVGSTLTRGTNYSTITSVKDVFDVKNILIIKAGTDLEGDGITAFALNTESVGQYGPRFGYLASPNTVDKIISEEKRVTGSESLIGSEWGTDRYPSVVSAGSDWDFHFYSRATTYPYNTTGAYAQSTSGKKSFNEVIRTEAKAQARITGNELVQTLGSPRFKATVELIHGSVGSYQMGDLVLVVDSSVGWWNTVANPGKKLRVHDVQHSFGNEWVTTLYLEEDEESVKSKYTVE